MRGGLQEQGALWGRILDAAPFAEAGPEEEVLTFFRDHGLKCGSRGVDIGCGNGRHVLAGLARGFAMTAVDISMAALQRTAASVVAEGRKSLTARASMTQLPFASDEFDFSLAWCVLNHGDRASFQLALEESIRVVRRQGVACGLVMTRRDPRVKLGRRVSANTVVFTAGPERDIVHYFPDAREIVGTLQKYGKLLHFTEDVVTMEEIRAFHPHATGGCHALYILEKR
jgi:SAM-dependent methyltransferase